MTVPNVSDMPSGNYCGICWALLLEDNPKQCDECGEVFLVDVRHCDGFVVFLPEVTNNCPICDTAILVFQNFKVSKV